MRWRSASVSTANRAAANKQLIHLWGGHVYGNNAFNYNYVAVAHGIQAIGRDLGDYSGVGFSDVTTFDGAIPLVGVRRSLPGYFRIRSDHVGLIFIPVRQRDGNGVRLVDHVKVRDDMPQLVPHETGAGALRNLQDVERPGIPLHRGIGNEHDGACGLLEDGYRCLLFERKIRQSRRRHPGVRFQAVGRRRSGRRKKTPQAPE